MECASHAVASQTFGTNKYPVDRVALIDTNLEGVAEGPQPACRQEGAEGVGLLLALLGVEEEEVDP